MANNNNNFSSLLISAIKAKGITVEKLAESTGVSERFIVFMLEDKFEELPALPYLHGYIMKIAEALDLDGEEIWDKYFKDNEFLKSSGEKDHLPPNRFAISGINKKMIAITVIILLVIGYFVGRALLSFDIARELSLEGMEKGTIFVGTSTLVLKGLVNPAYQLTVNDEPIYPDNDGRFEKALELKPGFNTLIFKIKGFLGREDKVVKQVYYKTPSSKLIPEQNNQNEQKKAN